eukprot:g14330.t1
MDPPAVCPSLAAPWFLLRFRRGFLAGCLPLLVILRGFLDRRLWYSSSGNSDVEEEYHHRLSKKPRRITRSAKQPAKKPRRNRSRNHGAANDGQTAGGSIAPADHAQCSQSSSDATTDSGPDSQPDSQPDSFAAGQASPDPPEAPCALEVP